MDTSSPFFGGVAYFFCGRGCLGFRLLCSTCWGSASSRRRALLLCLGYCRALTLRCSLLTLSGCWAPRLRGSCGLWWALVGVCAGLFLLVSWSSALVVSAGLLVALLVGCEAGGVMDRGGLDGLSFERGGLQCARVWAAASSLVGGLRFSPCFSPCFVSVGLRGVRVDPLPCFEVATLRARRAGLLGLVCLLWLLR